MTISIDEAKNLFISFGKSQRGFTENTVYNYEKAIEYFADSLGDEEKQNVSLITLEHFDQFSAILDGRGNDSITIRSKLIALRSLFNYLRRRGYIEENPAVDVELPPLRSKYKACPTVEHRQIMLSGPNEEKWLECRDKLIMLLGFDSGLRRIDMANIQIGKIDFKNKTGILKGKGEVEEPFYFPEETKRVMLKYLDIRKVAEGNEDWLLVNKNGKHLQVESIDRIIRKWRRRLHLPDFITTHSLRHFFGTHWLHDGGELRSLQVVMRHKKPETTIVYDDEPRERAQQEFIKIQESRSASPNNNQKKPLKKIRRSLLPEGI